MSTSGVTSVFVESPDQIKNLKIKTSESWKDSLHSPPVTPVVEHVLIPHVKLCCCVTEQGIGPW